MKKDTLFTTKNMAFTGLFVAIIAILSQISIPTPTNVPITLQTFAIALAGYFLGAKLGTASVVVYVLLGTVGIPVFANFKGGISAITGYTGGFLYGFIFLALFAGLGVAIFKSGAKRYVLASVFGIIGLCITHLLGAIQYATLASLTLWQSLLAVTVPFLIKDIVSVILAFALSEVVSKRLIKTGVAIG